MGTDTPQDQPPGRGKTDSLSPSRGGRATERELGLKIARDGGWWHHGAPIRRLPLVKLLASVLRRAEDGSYWLVTPVERGRIEVADVPFVAVELAASGRGRAQRLRLRSNLDEWVTVGLAHPLRARSSVSEAASGALVPPAADAALIPYVELRAGLEARLVRPVYYELVALGEERREGDRTRFGVWSEGHFFALDEAA